MAVHHSNFEQSLHAALQGPDTVVARPTGAPASQRETIMSKLARILAVGVLLTAMSLGSAAYAQDGNAQSQPAGITQSDPSQPQDPGTPTDPAAPQDPGPPQNPAPPQDPGATPGSTTTSTTTTTPPPVSRPKKLPVTVSPRAGRPGTPVPLRPRA